LNRSLYFKALYRSLDTWTHEYTCNIIFCGVYCHALE